LEVPGGLRQWRSLGFAGTIVRRNRLSSVVIFVRTLFTLTSPRQRTFVAVTVLVLHLTVLLLPGMALRSALSNVVVLIAVLLAAEACWQAGKRESDSTRYFWQLTALAFLFWATGQTVWIGYENVLRVSVPITSLADVFYLGWAAPLLLALFVRPNGIGNANGRAGSGMCADFCGPDHHLYGDVLGFAACIAGGTRPEYPSRL
jgi:hypothetical protein